MQAGSGSGSNQVRIGFGSGSNPVQIGFIYKCKRKNGTRCRSQPPERDQNIRICRDARARFREGARGAAPRETHGRVGTAARGRNGPSGTHSKTVPRGHSEPNHKTVPGTHGVNQKLQKQNPKTSPARRSGGGPQKATAGCAPGRLSESRFRLPCRSRKKTPKK